MGMSAFVSALEMFSVGIGPSSSHTVGPMRAAARFADELVAAGVLERIDRVDVSLYGSLGATGLGHGTPDAVVVGLQRKAPETVDPAEVRGAWSSLQEGARINLAGMKSIPFRSEDISFEPRTRLPEHPNAMTLRAWSNDEALPVLESTYFSIGGGFIRKQGEHAPEPASHPYEYLNSAAVLEVCRREGIDHAELSWRNEVAVHGEDRVIAGLDAIWAGMAESVRNGLATEGTLPGGLRVQRRAAKLARDLESHPSTLPESTTEWLQAWAMAVNEENAGGGRVVTAPTNGAAGIIPSVGHYYMKFVPGADQKGIRKYLLTASIIGSIIKANASISGAEGGCQAEVGSACAMAAAGLCAMLGGTPEQVENAAEIAIEHHLGLTCDPVGGLVQVPCIERNAIASSTAVTAARLALRGDGSHVVSFDTVIETMRQTGQDMSTKYKETSEGGLAVNVVEC